MSQSVEDAEEVWIGSESVSGEEFVQALNTVQELQEELREFQDGLGEMNIGLDQEDAVALLWGRTSLNKGQIEAAFEAMNAFIEEEPEDVAPRILADRSSDLTLAEAAEVWDEIVTLAEKYGTNDDDS